MKSVILSLGLILMGLSAFSQDITADTILSRSYILKGDSCVNNYDFENATQFSTKAEQ